MFLYLHENSIHKRLDKIENRLELSRELEIPYTNTSVKGQYFPSRKFFWVDTTQEPVLETTLHEYAHYLYYQKLSPSDREEWINISNSSEKYVTSYARKNAEEDFAETYSHGTICSFVGTGITAKDNFVKKVT
jgi:hypothetical protein